MPIVIYTARVSETTRLSDKFVFLSLELVEPNRLEFTAGQYILLSIPGTEQKKSYSITSSPAIDHAIELLVDVSPHGIGTQYIEQLKPGDTVTFRAPVGGFFVAQTDTELGREEQELVFVATGSGITPIRSMILDQLQMRNDTRPMVLYWGLRHESDLFWQDEFLLLAENYKNFRFHPVLSQALEAWPLCRGHVTDCLLIHGTPERAGYYLCGNRGMIEDARRLLLERGVSEQHIHHEKFY